MPFSDEQGKEHIAKWFQQIKPQWILDIGCGSGTYSDLLKDKWSKAHWIGVEAWAPYITEFDLNKKYEKVIIADALYLDYDQFPTFDLIILGDVIEHLGKDQAKWFINRLKTHSKNIIISIPLLHLEQEAYEGNWFEIHRDHWDYDEMLDFLNSCHGIPDDVIGVFWWENKNLK